MFPAFIARVHWSLRSQPQGSRPAQIRPAAIAPSNWSTSMKGRSRRVSSRSWANLSSQEAAAGSSRAAAEWKDDMVKRSSRTNSTKNVSGQYRAANSYTHPQERSAWNRSPGPDRKLRAVWPVFFHPDCYRRPWSFTRSADPAQRQALAGFHRRWGFTPRPEDVRQISSIMRGRAGMAQVREPGYPLFPR